MRLGKTLGPAAIGAALLALAPVAAAAQDIAPVGDPLDVALTTGPLLLRALTVQDMYLAGSIILLLGVLTLVGMLISDILLAILDPRIRFN